MPNDDIEPNKLPAIIRNGAADQFAAVVRDQEKSVSAKECILCALNSYDTLIAQGENEKAVWELRKIVDIILQTYQSDEKARLHDCLGRRDLTAALQGILEIYTHVVNGPQKQYQPDNRTIATSLV